MNNDNDSFASHTTMLAQANEAVLRATAHRRDRWYPSYHIAAQAGWINDPNGLCYFKGRYHVFFQHHPFGVEWGPMHWGHISSEDLVAWRNEPIALAPSLDADRNGCWSGSCVVGRDGRLYAFYTGNCVHTDPHDPLYRRQTQCAAVSDDGIHFQKLGVVVPGIEPMECFRDPKVWLQGDTWCMVVGQQSKQHRGQVALYTSENLLRWDYAGVIYEHPDPNVFMLECPDLFELDGQWVLCFSAMGMHPRGFLARNANNAGYVVGTWNLGEPFEANREFMPCDAGHNFYAPQSFAVPDGRRIQLGWMNPLPYKAPEQDDGWCGQLTLPRELSLDGDGIVVARPASEMSQLLNEGRRWGSTLLGANEERVIAEDVRCGCLEMTVDLSSSTAERLGVELHHTDDGGSIYVAYDAQTDRVIVDRHSASRGNRGYRTTPLPMGTKHLTLQIWLDRGALEVYVNDGKWVLSELSYPSEGSCAIVLVSESGSTHVESLHIRPMKQT